jgi:hypothetical protein
MKKVNKIFTITLAAVLGIVCAFLVIWTIESFAAEITITGLTDVQAQALVGQNMTKYVGDYANYLIARQVSEEKDQLLRVLTAKTDAELKAAAAPIIAAEKAKAEAEAQPK